MWCYPVYDLVTSGERSSFVFLLRHRIPNISCFSSTRQAGLVLQEEGLVCSIICYTSSVRCEDIVRSQMYYCPEDLPSSQWYRCLRIITIGLPS